MKTWFLNEVPRQIISARIQNHHFQSTFFPFGNNLINLLRGNFRNALALSAMATAIAFSLGAQCFRFCANRSPACGVAWLDGWIYTQCINPKIRCKMERTSRTCNQSVCVSNQLHQISKGGHSAQVYHVEFVKVRSMFFNHFSLLFGASQEYFEALFRQNLYKLDIRIYRPQHDRGHTLHMND